MTSKKINKNIKFIIYMSFKILFLFFKKWKKSKPKKKQYI